MAFLKVRLAQRRRVSFAFTVTRKLHGLSRIMRLNLVTHNRLVCHRHRRPRQRRAGQGSSFPDLIREIPFLDISRMVDVPNDVRPPLFYLVSENRAPNANESEAENTSVILADGGRRSYPNIGFINRSRSSCRRISGASLG